MRPSLPISLLPWQLPIGRRLLLPDLNRLAMPPASFAAPRSNARNDALAYCTCVPCNSCVLLLSWSSQCFRCADGSNPGSISWKAGPIRHRVAIACAGALVFDPYALPSFVHSVGAQGPGNTIRAQQVLFQSQKKVTGNTHTARGMPANLFAFIFIGTGGTFVVLSALRKLYWGIGKIELDKD